MVRMYFEVRKFFLLRAISPAAICKAVQYQHGMIILEKETKHTFQLKGTSFGLDPNVEGETQRI